MSLTPNYQWISACPAKSESCCSTQLIDGDGVFNVTGIENFMKEVNLRECGLSYAVVSIMGPQSSGMPSHSLSLSVCLYLRSSRPKIHSLQWHKRPELTKSSFKLRWNVLTEMQTHPQLFLLLFTTQLVLWLLSLVFVIDTECWRWL